MDHAGLKINSYPKVSTYFSISKNRCADGVADASGVGLGVGGFVGWDDGLNVVDGAGEG